MSINLMDLAKGYLGKQVMSQMGGILGESPEKTESAIGGALPALIGGFMKKGSTQGGLDELMKGMEDHDDGILDNIGDIFGGGDSSGFMNGGSGILKMLFGGGMGGVLDMLSKSSGFGSKSITSLLSMLAPIVLGVIKKQFMGGGMDAAGLSNMLSSQKDHISGALPSGFGDMLGLSGITGAAGQAVGAVGDAGRAVAGGVGDAGRAVAGGVGSAADGIRGATNSAAAGGGSILGKILPLVALVALALIAMQMFGGGNKDGAEDADGVVPAVELEEGQSELNLSPPDAGSGTLEPVNGAIETIEEGASGTIETIEGAVEGAVEGAEGIIEGATGDGQ